MIIELSDQFEQVDANEFGDRYQIPIGNLIDAHKNGWHLLLASRGTLSNILQTDFLSTHQHAVVENIYENIAVERTIASNATVSVLVVPSGAPTIPENPRHQTVISLEEFADPDLCQPTQVLVEDQVNDGGFLRILCHALHKELGLSTVPQPVFLNGGGGRMGAVLAQLLERNRFTVVVVDSDKESPTASFGNTAQLVRNAIEANPSRFVRERVLTTREAENLISLEYCSDLYKDNPEVQTTIRKIERLEQNDRAAATPPHEYLMRYFDLKVGLHRSKVASAANEDTRQYLIRSWRVLDPTETEFEVDDFEPIQDQICAGISTNLLRVFVEQSTRKPHFDRIRGCLKRSIFWNDVLELAQEICFVSAKAEVQRAL